MWQNTEIFNFLKFPASLLQGTSRVIRTISLFWLSSQDGMVSCTAEGIFNMNKEKWADCGGGGDGGGG